MKTRIPISEKVLAARVELALKRSKVTPLSSVISVSEKNMSHGTAQAICSRLGTSYTYKNGNFTFYK